MIGRMDSTRYRRSVRFVAGATGRCFREPRSCIRHCWAGDGNRLLRVSVRTRHCGTHPGGCGLRMGLSGDGMGWDGMRQGHSDIVPNDAEEEPRAQVCLVYNRCRAEILEHE